MSAYNINDLVREAQSRWLKPAEVYFILQNHETQMITNEPPQRPGSGSVFLFNKRVLRFFRKDGHSWRRKRDGRTVGEAHERLKVGNVEALNCYYAHGDPNPNFQRRSYWMLDPAYEHIVLVHYRDIQEGRNTAGTTIQFSPVSPSTFSQSPISYNSQQPGSSTFFSSLSSSGSAETGSDVATSSQALPLNNVERAEEATSSSGLHITQALRRLEEQLSLNDDIVEEISSGYTDNDNTYSLENVILGQTPSAATQGSNLEYHQQLLSQADWNQGIEQPEWTKDHAPDQDDIWLSLGRIDSQNLPVAQETEDLTYPEFSADVNAYAPELDNYTSLFDQGHIGMPLQDNMGITISQKQKFSIREISPEWGYASEVTKVFIIGSFLSDPSESPWTCMFDGVEVSAQIIQEGVICCQAPPHLPGKVSIYVTSGNRESCSEVREFEYRDKLAVCSNCRQPEVTSRSREELLLLVRLLQLLLSNSSLQRGDSTDSGIDLLTKSKAGEDPWGQVIDDLLVGTSTSSNTTDWLLEELLKDKLRSWLLSRSQKETDQQNSFLSKKEQGIIHMVAGLGFEWALPLILKSGVSVNYRDINGWTALHWAARFGREKMVAALIASGASAGAVTDPTPQDPTGKTAAFIASTSGHKGLAGYLSEVALTSHLSSLTLEESELSKGSANVEAEMTVNKVANADPVTNEDQLSLKVTLNAVRNAAQAAARIQSAFRAHSFRRRQQREAGPSSTGGDEFGILADDIEAVTVAASRLAFRNPRDYNSAAVSIQKKYRGWKGRKDFLALRQKVVKIQAHVRGYQVRKNYKVCWAVGILEKVILRWRRHGVGLRGFRNETEVMDEIEDEDILKVFRKQKVDATIDEAVSRVLSMVESPDARQQYRRLLEKYRQAKAELADQEGKQV
ncbi:OLC1v1028608C1 [Oldenlandia corymbosa var. corymbosa]|uniref:OLC1v1028608C1 n=1 Tax=Oldenlandia corymbosa var. corymbosa TaxID=529605 RepID=A0AAV1CER0_OLDCO|nr:OLC1v1028608C1 [Oldenlandia corymbosa var. corymbosa]